MSKVTNENEASAEHIQRNIKIMNMFSTAVLVKAFDAPFSGSGTLLTATIKITDKGEILPPIMQWEEPWTNCESKQTF